MESPEDRGEKTIAANLEDTSQLNRNRSFKSKQLVRSKAIREAASPPRTTSPAAVRDGGAVGDEPSDGTDVPAPCEARTFDRANASSHVACASDVISYSDSASDDGGRKHPVEIQITGGAWEAESQTEQRQRAKRWLGHKPAQRGEAAARDPRLLSNNPRVACVCGACGNCPHCRGRKRKHACPTKQDSGIVCSDDCADCSDSEQTGDPNEDGTRNNDSLDVNDQVFYCRCPEKKDKPKTISLSRTESDEKQEPTGLDLVNFIKETLNKNARDRITLLKIEKELHSLVNDTGRCIVRFPVMTSYGRMLVHRCAALFQLSHHLDQSNKTSVLVSKSGTSGGRIPCTRFRAWCTASFPPPASPQRGGAGGAAGGAAGGGAPGPDGDSVHAKCILKRGAWAGAEAGGALATRSKSLEQRERDYERVRRRIFSTDNCSQDESGWPWLGGGAVRLLAPEGGRNKLQKVQSLETSSGPKGRGPVSKSHSFGGYGGAGAGGGGAPDPPPPRLLSRQGDLASSSWRVSPSSSGYKTLSLRSTDSVTPSPTGDQPQPQPQPHHHHHQPHHHHQSGDASPEPALVWAVTDLAAVPPGALVIHPQTGRPLTNADGSLYHFDPARPPPLPELAAHLRHAQHKTEENGKKRRGKLEKQHSFIENESECRQVDECPGKCCCECRRRATQLPQQTDQKVETQPSSPCKSRYDPSETPTNPGAGQEPANHRQYDNQRQETNQRYEMADQTTPKYDNSTTQNYNDHRAYDITSQRTYEPTNHGAANESANQRAGKLTNQESVEAQYMQQTYVQGYRSDELSSPAQVALGAYPAQAQAQAEPPGAGSPAAYAHPLDPHIRTLSLNNMVYPSPMPHSYAYINQYRMVNWYDTPQQEAVYPHPQPQPHPHAAPADHKQHHDTFRIDPSYPYAAELGACGACCPDAARTRGYNVSYGGLEAAPAQLAAPPPAGLVLPQPHLQYQQYQEAMQWAGVAPPAVPPAVTPVAPAVPAPPAPPAAKLYLQELYPLLQYPAAAVYPHPHTHPHYNIMYPQMVPQPYPLCQPVYPLIDKPEAARRGSVASQRQKRTSVTNSSRTTPLQTPPEAPYGEAKGDPPRRQTPNEIAAKIQQINEQMSQLGVRSPPRPRDDWRRGHAGTGLLGSCPAAAGGGGRPVNDESQLSTAARAIVDSIRNMQAKNNSFKYQDGRRQQEGAPPPARAERERRRAAEQGARPRPAPPPPAPAPCRPPYLQMSPGTWCRQSPGPVHPVLNHPRRQHPDPRNGRR